MIMGGVVPRWAAVKELAPSLDTTGARSAAHTATQRPLRGRYQR